MSFDHDEQLGSLHQCYHYSSRNSLSSSRISPKYYYTYNDPKIPIMVAESARQTNSRQRVPLPVAFDLAELSLVEAITSRVSRRSFPDHPLRLDQLGTLLHLGNGVRAISMSGGLPSYQRNVPSCGNLGSTEVYPVLMNVEDVKPGIYHYDSLGHELEELRSGQFRDWIREFAIPQVEFSGAAVALVLTSAIGRLEAKYGRRSYRLALMDIGHVSENLQLSATAMGLSTCAANGFVDDELNRALDLDGITSATMLVLLVAPGQSSDAR